jgi:hypothetical protein
MAESSNVSIPGKSVASASESAKESDAMEDENTAPDSGNEKSSAETANPTGHRHYSSSSDSSSRSEVWNPLTKEQYTELDYEEDDVDDSDTFGDGNVTQETYLSDTKSDQISPLSPPPSRVSHTSSGRSPPRKKVKTGEHVHLSAPVMVFQSRIPKMASHTPELLAPFPTDNLFLSSVDNSRKVCLELSPGN